MSKILLLRIKEIVIFFVSQCSIHTRKKMSTFGCSENRWSNPHRVCSPKFAPDDKNTKRKLGTLSINSESENTKIQIKHKKHQRTY